MFTIFHIIDNLGVGGAQSMMFELYHAFNKYYPQYKQKIIYQSDIRYDAEFVSSYGISCKKVNNVNIIKKINKHKNVIVIYHKLANSNYKILEQIRNRTKSKSIIINHTLFKSHSWKKCKIFDIMIAVSKNMNNKFDEWYPGINHDFVYNGVCGDRYDNVKSLYDDKKNIFLTGRINRICGWKHSDKWVEWCLTVKLPIKMVHEYIGSNYSRNRRLTRVKIKKSRNDVKMMGGINNFKTKVSIIKNWDVFLYETNNHEGLSMSILESMACGVPVICSNHFGNKEIIKKGINGYIFKDRDYAKKIMSNLINNPEELKELRKTTKQYFDENLDAKYTVGKYVNIIHKISSDKKECEKTILHISEIENPNKKFSILTSSFNKEEYLNNWARSVLSQKYRPLEVVFANDCSSDSTLKIINRFKNDFNSNGIELVLVDNKNRLYCGSSYNNLVKYATGSYFGVLDADDMLVDDAVEYIMKKYNEYPDIAWIYTQFDIYDHEMKYRKKGFCCCPERGENLLSLGAKRIHGFGHWRTFSYKFPKINKIFGNDLKCGVDKFMGYRLEEFASGMFVDRVCYKYRRHAVGSPKSVSSTKEAIIVWNKIMVKAKSRRSRYNLKPFQIINCNKI